MTYDPDKHHRRSIRLRGYDYSQSGAYFITICTQDRGCLFGEVVDGEMRLNQFGELVEMTWHNLPHHVDGIVLDAFVVMPNHVHGIIMIVEPSVGTGSAGTGFVGAGFVRAGSEPAPTTDEPPHKKRHGLPEIVRQFKTFSARHINSLRHASGGPVWQRNYYEHVIRNEKSVNSIREYIINNPLQWELDRENPNIVWAGLTHAPTEDAPWRT
jgi:REP element-mobilizing transposase RayT